LKVTRAGTAKAGGEMEEAAGKWGLQCSPPLGLQRSSLQLRKRQTCFMHAQVGLTPPVGVRITQFLSVNVFSHYHIAIYTLQRYFSRIILKVGRILFFNILTSAKKICQPSENLAKFGWGVYKYCLYVVFHDCPIACVFMLSVMAA